MRVSLSNPFLSLSLSFSHLLSHALTHILSFSFTFSLFHLYLKKELITLNPLISLSHFHSLIVCMYKARHRSALDKYLLKTLCTDLVNVILEIEAHDYHLLHLISKSSTDRSQLLQQLPTELSKALEKLIKTLDTVTFLFLSS